MFGKAMPSIIISEKSITAHRFEALPNTIQKKENPIAHVQVAQILNLSTHPYHLPIRVSRKISSK